MKWKQIIVSRATLKEMIEVILERRHIIPADRFYTHTHTHTHARTHTNTHREDIRNITYRGKCVIHFSYFSLL